MSDNGFAHQRLDAYRVAIQLFRGVEQLVSRFPKGYADLRDQLRRAAAATPRHIAEGANRLHPKDKAARFVVAKGECGECDATLEMVEIAGLASRDEVQRLRTLADRVSAMLLGLIRCERRQARAGP